MITRKYLPLSLFVVGLLFALSTASFGTWSLMENLNTLTRAELQTTIWAEGEPLFTLWALSVTLGTIVAAVGAMIYVRTKPIFIWLTPVAVLLAVGLMVMVWSRYYNPTLFGIGGLFILGIFFAILWVWMQTYAKRDMPAKIAGSFKLVGYMFWINASWFLCGETAKLHLKAFAGSAVPSPIEIMAFLAFGWLFVLVGDALEMRLRQRAAAPSSAGRRSAQTAVGGLATDRS